MFARKEKDFVYLDELKPKEIGRKWVRLKRKRY